MSTENGLSTIMDTLSPNRGPSIHTAPIFRSGRIESFQFLQPSMFWNRNTWELAGEFNPQNHYNMDREWCLVALSLGAQVCTTDRGFARFRYHPGSKSQSQGENFIIESALMYQRLSHLPAFRRFPCLLESWRFKLQVSQSKLYRQSQDHQSKSARWKGSIKLIQARIVRRMRLGIIKWMQVSRSLVLRNKSINMTE